MQMIRIRSTLGRNRNSFLVTGVILLACLFIVVAHSDPGGHDMGGMTDDTEMAMTDVMSLCLGVLQIGGLALLGTVIIARRRRFPTFSMYTGQNFSRVADLAGTPGHQSRAGPSVLQVFRH